MESLRLSFESIMPIFILMALGYMLKNIKVVGEDVFNGMNKLIFKLFLPVLLFYNIYKTESFEIFDIKLILFAIIGLLVVFAVGYVSVLFLSKDNAKRGAMLQGMFRSNYAILGVPLVNYVCGEKAGGLASLMVAVVVPMLNVLAVICLERFRDGNVNIRKTLKGIVTNPLIIGCIIGLVFLVSGIKLPSLVEKSVGDVAKIASPLAIIVLGAGFTFSSIKGYAKEITVVVLAKLVIVPLVMLTAAALLGFRGEAMACLMVAFGSPVAVSSFSMAQQMGSDETLAAQLVVISSAFCLVTLFMWIFVLNSFGLFY